MSHQEKEKKRNKDFSKKKKRKKNPKAEIQIFLNHFWISFTKHLYFLAYCKLSKSQKSWSSSKTICQSNGGKLFEPQSYCQNITVMLRSGNLIVVIKSIWIGLTDASSEGNWKYNGCHWKVYKCSFMKQKCHF